MKQMKMLKKTFAIVMVVMISIGISSVCDTKAATLNKPAVEKHTAKEIRNFIKKNPVDTSQCSYKVEPKTTGSYSAGELSAETLKNALNAVNQMRYIAGLPSDVKLNSDYTKAAQAATLVNAANNTMSHSPSKPGGMKDSLYELGYSGASSSNLGWGYSSPADSVFRGWMRDEDSGNIDRVGHRRWVLHSKLKETGFGMAGTFNAMKVFDTGSYDFSESKYKGIVWPAQTMPVGYFRSDDPWTVSMGDDVDASKVKVVLVRKRDNKKWVFSKKKADGYFNVNNDGYGDTGCIIFRPDNLDEITSKDKFSVKITGLSSGTFKYNVKFFDY